MVSVAVIAAIVTGIGVALGYLLAAVIPGLSLGLAIVAGMVAAVGTLDLFLRLISALNRRASASEEGDEASEFDEPFVVIPRGFWRASRRRKKKG